MKFLIFKGTIDEVFEQIQRIRGDYVNKTIKEILEVL